ncbi:metal-dependent hydrolase [Sphingomonas sp. BAUL-RG-20F-R05-02]|uniref:metal-dependent hydrolase n=1 Tax=Sphingomonas sp. BAUL-RG-20F-R05-02 TaxID=2914830 RepID=UPI001F57B911|nr:metal-dependent hydrolase [Sphingomonas sp. BAUL-RG-20F-R05-02]
MAKATTTADLTITPRDLRFGRGMRRTRWWMNDDPVATAFYNALSITFPKGEGFFVDSVRAFRDGTPPRLAAEINAFIKQEVMHTREHVAFNRHVTDQGYDVSLLDIHVDEALALTDGKPVIARLAATMALEHFTAILAHALLADPRHLDGAEPQAAAMWRWHAAEEIEHKGVAYDTWLHATRDWSRTRRWLFKSLVMLTTARKFFVGRYLGIIELLRQDGITGPRAHLGTLSYALVRPGMVRKIFGAWASYFLPGFHPWNSDDRALIARAESDYAAAVLPRAALAA